MLLNKKDPLPPRPYDEDPKHHSERREGVLISNVIERIKARELGHERIRIDLNLYAESIDNVTIPRYDRADHWTQHTSDALIYDGYQKVKGMPGYDSIIWWGVPVYVRLHGTQQFDIHVRDKAGNFIYSQDNPGTLDDERKSTAVKDFIKGMFRTSYDKMDLQKLAMAAIVGIGAIFGLSMLGVI